jgi:hypothetical protein
MRLSKGDGSSEAMGLKLPGILAISQEGHLCIFTYSRVD